MIQDREEDSRIGSRIQGDGNWVTNSKSSLLRVRVVLPDFDGQI